MLFFEDTAGMFRAKLIMFAAMALLFAQLQCAAACNTRLCDSSFGKRQSVPPCHRHHHHPNHDQVPGPCAHQIIGVPAGSHQILPVKSPTFGVLSLTETVSASVPAGAGTNVHRLTDPSPPGFESLSSVVLRI